MSDAVFEQYVDEYGNLSVRVSNDVVVLTKEDAARVVAEYNQLKAENAMLRDGYGSMSREKSQLTVDYSDALYEIDRLKAENEKLLGLVRLAHRYIAESCAVQYPYAPEPVSYLSQLEFERQMRELGVEVDA